MAQKPTDFNGWQPNTPWRTYGVPDTTLITTQAQNDPAQAPATPLVGAQQILPGGVFSGTQVAQGAVSSTNISYRTKNLPSTSGVTATYDVAAAGDWIPTTLNVGFGGTVLIGTTVIFAPGSITDGTAVDVSITMKGITSHNTVVTTLEVIATRLFTFMNRTTFTHMSIPPLVGLNQNLLTTVSYTNAIVTVLQSSGSNFAGAAVQFTMTVINR